MGRVRAVPRLCEFYPDICLTTEEKARKNLSQGSRRVSVGTFVHYALLNPVQFDVQVTVHRDEFF